MCKRVASVLLAVMLVSACQTAPVSNPAAAVSQSDAERVTAAPSEAEAWAIASQAKVAAPLHAYLARFPDGEHQASAQLRLKLVQKGALK